MGILRYTLVVPFWSSPTTMAASRRPTLVSSTPVKAINRFINAMKLSPTPIFADNLANTVTPDLLSADGYPLATGSHGGYHWTPIIPTGTERPGNWIITWDGAGSIFGTGAGGSQLGTAA